MARNDWTYIIFTVIWPTLKFGVVTDYVEERNIGFFFFDKLKKVPSEAGEQQLYSHQLMLVVRSNTTIPLTYSI